MGANGSAHKRKSSLPQGIFVEKIKVTIDKKPTTIDERSAAVLKYRTPHFRGYASVSVPELKKGEAIQIGWVQACTEMTFSNAYGSEGTSSWEFPEINSGRYPMVSDSDGRTYPWYGSKQEVFKIVGPCQAKTAVVQMNDNFFPQVTWHVPDGRNDRTPKLSHIKRDQTFYAWLVVQDLRTNTFHVLKTTKWRMKIDITVDPQKPLGSRSVLNGPIDQEQPEVLQQNVPIPSCALRAPNANNSQILIWRPVYGKPCVVVPPIETTMDIKKYVSTAGVEQSASSVSSTNH